MWNLRRMYVTSRLINVSLVWKWPFTHSFLPYILLINEAHCVSSAFAAIAQVFFYRAPCRGKCRQGEDICCRHCCDYDAPAMQLHSITDNKTDSPCSPLIGVLSVFISVWWASSGRAPFLQIKASCLFCKNNHIKSLQLAHSYKYTERDVALEEGGWWDSSVNLCNAHFFLTRKIQMGPSFSSFAFINLLLKEIHWVFVIIVVRESELITVLIWSYRDRHSQRWVIDPDTCTAITSPHQIWNLT